MKARHLLLLLFIAACKIAGADEVTENLVQKVNEGLHLSMPKQAQVDPIVQRVQDEINKIKGNTALTSRQKREQIHDTLKSLTLELKPYLTSNEERKLSEVLQIRAGFHLQLGVDGRIIYPTTSEARAIFGDSEWSYGVTLESYGIEVGDRSRFGVSGGLYSMVDGNNSVYVIAPVGYYEYRVPIADQLYAYTNLSAGPAYMDYSFNTPDDQHFGAKRLGATGTAELGLKWGPVRFALDYDAFTEPAGISFNGWSASATVVVLRI